MQALFWGITSGCGPQLESCNLTTDDHDHQQRKENDKYLPQISQVQEVHGFITYRPYLR